MSELNVCETKVSQVGKYQNYSVLWWDAM